MQDFLDQKIKAWSFRKMFMHKRNEDIDECISSGYNYYYETKKWETNEYKFREEFANNIYSCKPQEDIMATLKNYIEGAKKYNIKGEFFFQPLYDDISVDIRDFYPRNRKEAEVAGWYDTADEFGFPELSEKEYKEEHCIDENELRRRIMPIKS